MTNCPHEVEFAEKLATLDQRSKSNTHRLDELDAWKKDQSSLISSVAMELEAMALPQPKVSNFTSWMISLSILR